MQLFTNPYFSVAMCAAMAICTHAVKGTLWSFGNFYWLALCTLAVLHLAASIAVIYFQRKRTSIVFIVLSLLILGQWWLIQMLAMQIIWRLRGFGP